MTTSAAEKENVMKAIHYGCDGYIIKPYTKQNIEEHLFGLKLYDPELAAREQAEKEAKEKAQQTAANVKPEKEAKEDTQQNVDEEEDKSEEKNELPQTPDERRE